MNDPKRASMPVLRSRNIRKGRGPIANKYRDPAVVKNYEMERFGNPGGEMEDRMDWDILRTMLAQVPHGSVLDLACGTGRISRRLVGLCPNCQVLSLDFSISMLLAARRFARDIGVELRLINADCFSLPFADGSFDLAVSLRFFRHFEDTDRQKLYAEVWRVLKPGGRLVLDAWNFWRNRPWRRQMIYDAMHTLSLFEREMRGANFDVIRIGGSWYPTSRLWRFLSKVADPDKVINACEGIEKALRWKRALLPLARVWFALCRKSMST